MDTKYQVIFVGADNPLRGDIQSGLKERLADLGLGEASMVFIGREEFDLTYRSNAPTVCIYFGGSTNSLDVTLLSRLLFDACLIIPVVDDLQKFSALVPDVIRPLNGFELNEQNSDQKIHALLSTILEGLSLLRKTRKLFLSYRRKESRSVALQLYSFLDEHGFNIFLDTHSIGAGAKFQDELWHSLADTEILVLLNTDNFVGNKWTDAELAQASAMSIGITQLVWPNCTREVSVERSTAFATPVYLKETDFEGGDYQSEKAKLTDSFLMVLENSIESLRARALAARQDNLLKEFLLAARARSIDATLQSDKVITFDLPGAGRIAVIPTVGVPDVYSSYQRDVLVKQGYNNEVTEAWILYDHRNVLNDYQVFVGWLSPLPVKFKKITDIDNCF